jgi:hypothetical protein
VSDAVGSRLQRLAEVEPGPLCHSPGSDSALCLGPLPVTKRLSGKRTRPILRARPGRRVEELVSHDRRGRGDSDCEKTCANC